MRQGLHVTGWIIGAVALISLAALGATLPGVHFADSAHALRFAALLAMAIAASRMEVSLPRLNGNMSVNLPFILIALASGQHGIGEALVIAAVSTFTQCMPHHGNHMKPAQYLFNVCNMINATALAGLAFRQAHSLPPASGSLLIVAAAAAFFLADTAPVALIIAVSEQMPSGSVGRVWREIFQLTFPYFVLSAGLSAIVIGASLYIGWYALALLPLLYGVYRSYQAYWAEAGSELSRSHS